MNKCIQILQFYAFAMHKRVVIFRSTPILRNVTCYACITEVPFNMSVTSPYLVTIPSLWWCDNKEGYFHTTLISTQMFTGKWKRCTRQIPFIIPSLSCWEFTPVLKSLHWLPVSYRIDFKVLLLVYKSLNGLGPEYMNDILVEYKPSRALRSTDSGQIVEPRVQTKHGEAAFSRYAAQNWNKLPAELKSAPTVNIFKSRLKTPLFSCAYDWARSKHFKL